MRQILLSLLILASVDASASQTSVYIAQNTSGSNSGADCSDAHSALWFNTAADWGPGSAQIGPGSTVHICGTISSALMVLGSGSSGAPITLQWEPGASLSACNSTGALQLGGRSYLGIDLGGNPRAITCPANGTGSGAVAAVGIGTGGNSLSYTEIRNGTIGPLYQYSCCGSDGTSSVGISIFGGTNDHFHDLSLNNVNAGIVFDLGNGVSSSGNEINNNSCASSVGRCIDYSNGDGTAVTDIGAQIHNNDIAFGSGWYSGTGDYTHLEAIRSFNYGGAGLDSISGLLIYNNYIHGVVTGDATSFVFIPDGLSCPSSHSSLSAKIFNNLMVMTGGSGPGDGFIFTQDCAHTLEIYNNTLDGGNNSIGMCMEFEGTNIVTARNNICENVQTMIYNAGPGITLTADMNIYFNVGSSGSNGWYWKGTEYTTLSGWTGATGQDLGSSTGNPGLNSDYTITGAGSLAHALSGANLSNLGVAQLDSDKPASAGPGANGTANPRSPAGAWDLGAYSLSTSAPAAPITQITSPASGSTVP